jgi:hypothetical protein
MTFRRIVRDGMDEEPPPGGRTMRPVAGKLIVLFVVGALLLNFPVLAILNRPVMVAGIPALYLYLFGVWVLGIAAVVVLARRPWDGER